MKIDLFVYGTLKRKCRNHSLMKNATFIHETNTKEKYTMLNLDMFPGVIKGEKTSNIQGELYQIDRETLETLDIFEGKWFSRQMIDLECNEKAWMYFLDRKLAEMLNKYHIIEDGKWEELHN